MRSVVDLPQPEGPTRTMNSRSAMSRLKSRTTRTPSSVTFAGVLFSASPLFLRDFFSLLG